MKKHRLFNVLVIIFAIFLILYFVNLSTTQIIPTCTSQRPCIDCKVELKAYIKQLDKHVKVELNRSNKNFLQQVEDVRLKNKKLQQHIFNLIQKQQNAESVKYANRQSEKESKNEKTNKEKEEEEEEEEESTMKVMSTEEEQRTPLCDSPSPMGRKIISYSLFGREAEHLGRFIKEVSEEALSIDPYKDFTLRIHVDSAFSRASRLKLLKSHSNIRFCDVRHMPRYGDISNTIGTIWRFMPMADPTVDIFCSRDLDSPLLQRGGDAVKEFLSTNNILHVMRDRRQHSIPIMGGMWCYRPSLNLTISRTFLEDILRAGKRELDFSTRMDQVIIENILWPFLKDNSLQHDSYKCARYPGSKPFPTKRRDYFVGCVRDCYVFKKQVCPVECRPKDHQDWNYC